MYKTKFFCIITFLIVFLSFNAFAMNNDEKPFVYTTPSTEPKHEDREMDSRWLWISDDECINFMWPENTKKSTILKQYEVVGLRRWVDRSKDQPEVKTRDTYAGKWSQDEAGIWSFTFDDCTIPVGVTKIDGVLYAFNAYGELRDGYNYWGDLKTAADGLVVSEDAEFLKYLETEYLPECTSHE